MSAETGAAMQIPNARWWRIIPPTIIIYIIAYMDRMNIGFAMAGGMNKELGLSMAASGLAGGHIFLGIPGAASSRRAHRGAWQC